MNHWKLTLLTVVVLMVLLFTGKLFWDEYQQNRASQKMPEVMRILDSVEIPGREIKTMPSVNEYSASVWRYYENEIPITELKERVQEQIEPAGFSFFKRHESYGGPQYSFRKGEYEVIVAEVSGDTTTANVALSVNWYGIDR